MFLRFLHAFPVDDLRDQVSGRYVPARTVAFSAKRPLGAKDSPRGDSFGNTLIEKALHNRQCHSGLTLIPSFLQSSRAVGFCLRWSTGLPSLRQHQALRRPPYGVCQDCPHERPWRLSLWHRAGSGHSPRLHRVLHGRAPTSFSHGIAHTARLRLGHTRYLVGGASAGAASGSIVEVRQAASPHVARPSPTSAVCAVSHRSPFAGGGSGRLHGRTGGDSLVA